MFQNGAAGNPPTNEYSPYVVQPLASVSPVQSFTQHSNVEISVVADMLPTTAHLLSNSFISIPQSRCCDRYTCDLGYYFLLFCRGILTFTVMSELCFGYIWKSRQKKHGSKRKRVESKWVWIIDSLPEQTRRARSDILCQNAVDPGLLRTTISPAVICCVTIQTSPPASPSPHSLLRLDTQALVYLARDTSQTRS